jgi:hypothetical protein
MTWSWPRSQQMILPSFVSRNIGNYFSAVDFSVDAVRRSDPENYIFKTTAAIYGFLKNDGIFYERNKLTEPKPSPIQNIRTPWEIRQQHRGTCLDLTLLFCGMCAFHELFPVILLFEDHAFAAVCNTHDLHSQRSDKRSLYPALAKNNPKQLFGDQNKFLEEVLKKAYLVIECTGFAADESRRDSDGNRHPGDQLSFADAVAAGIRHLEDTDQPYFCAIDVTIAWQEWGIIPAQNPHKTPAPLIFVSQPPPTLDIEASLEFVGRKQELEELHAFLKSRPHKPGIDFLWAFWTGPGGQGKSRLAWQFCRAAQIKGWTAGFLGSTPFAEWCSWEITDPTLLVIDQVARRPATIRNAILALSQNTNHIIAPLRLLLLERSFEPTDPWVEDFSSPGSDDTRYLLEYMYGSPKSLVQAQRPLEPLSLEELWQVMTAVLDVFKKTYPDRELTLKRLEKIDPSRRPLFAIFMAKAIAEHGNENWRSWNQRELLTWVLKREFDSWKKQLVKGVTPGDRSHRVFEKHLNAVTVATIGGRQTEATLKRYSEEFHVELPKRLLPNYLHNINAYAPRVVPSTPEEIVHPLAPDILGELFILERLAGGFAADSNTSVPAQQTKRILDVAFAMDRFPTVDFIVRTIRDFGTHRSIQAFGQIDVPEGAKTNNDLVTDHAITISNIQEQVTHHALDAPILTGLIAQHRALLARQDQEQVHRNTAYQLAGALYKRGVVFQESNLQAGRFDFDDAIAVLDVHLNPMSRQDPLCEDMRALWADILIERALNHWKANDSKAAFQDLHDVVKQGDLIPRELAEAYLRRGLFYEKLKDLDKAIGEYEHLMDIEDFRAKLHREIALDRLLRLVLARYFKSRIEGNLDLAEYCLDRLIQLNNLQREIVRKNTALVAI